MEPTDSSERDGGAGRIDALLETRGEWACLIGPQAAGKSVYAQYLRSYDPADRHHWSMRRVLRRAAGNLTFTRVADEDREVLVEATMGPAATPPGRFSQPNPTKDLILFSANPAKLGETSSPRAPLHFFDVPGEAVALLDQLVNPGRLKTMMQKTRVVVFFVPFWGLLPGPWLEREGYEALFPPAGPQKPGWATSLSLDRDDFSKAVTSVESHVLGWMRYVLNAVGANTDLMLVLSQFQRESVVTLLNAFFGGDGGENIWRAYDEALASEPAADAPSTTVLAKTLRTVSALGFELLDGIVAASGKDRGHSTVCECLQALWRRSGGPAEEAGKLARIRSVSILPLNVIAVRSQAEWDTWSGQQDATKLADLRMCEDLLWWILLHQRGHELWRW